MAKAIHSMVRTLKGERSARRYESMRMSEAARDGVVSEHGQAHDIADLLIADSSQFSVGEPRRPRS